VHVTRRRLLQGIVAGSAIAAPAEAAHAASSDPAPAGDPLEVLRIWPDLPPGSDGVNVREETVERDNALGLRDRIILGVTQPRIAVFRPRGRPQGALLLLPGGGYRHVVVDKEGFETARWLSERGMAVFVLFYRLPADGWAAGPDAPLQDAQRAMRLLRAQASKWAIDPACLGVIGFSAGGHLAARLACSHSLRTYADIDEVDEQSARPDIAGLIYPVVTMDTAVAHAGSRQQLLGAAPTPDRVHAYSAETAACGHAPPTFILHAEDDSSVPLENALRMRAALHAAGVAVDLHVFSVGGHGFGLRAIAGKPVAAWPQLFLDWATWQLSQQSREHV
jgi:acetyl esterase/lipase